MTAPILHDSPVPLTAASNRERLFRLLLDRGPHTQQECMRAGGMRYGARLEELRKLGHDIETIRVDHARGAYEYRLIRLASEVKP